MLKKAFLLALVAVSFSNCDSLRRDSLTGVYKRVGGPDSFAVNQFEIRGSKVIMETMLGEMVTEYKIDSDDLYVGVEGGQVRFKIVSPDTLRNDATFGYKGTFAKVK